MGAGSGTGTKSYDTFELKYLALEYYPRLLESMSIKVILHNVEGLPLVVCAADSGLNRALPRGFPRAPGSKIGFLKNVPDQQAQALAGLQHTVFAVQISANVNTRAPLAASVLVDGSICASNVALGLDRESLPVQKEIRCDRPMRGRRVDVVWHEEAANTGNAPARRGLVLVNVRWQPADDLSEEQLASLGRTLGQAPQCGRANSTLASRGNYLCTPGKGVDGSRAKGAHVIATYESCATTDDCLWLCDNQPSCHAIETIVDASGSGSSCFLWSLQQKLDAADQAREVYRKEPEDGQGGSAGAGSRMQLCVERKQLQKIPDANLETKDGCPRHNLPTGMNTTAQSVQLTAEAGKSAERTMVCPCPDGTYWDNPFCVTCGVGKFAQSGLTHAQLASPCAGECRTDNYVESYTSDGCKPPKDGTEDQYPADASNGFFDAGKCPRYPPGNAGYRVGCSACPDGQSSFVMSTSIASCQFLYTRKKTPYTFCDAVGSDDVATSMFSAVSTRTRGALTTPIRNAKACKEAYKVFLRESLLPSGGSAPAAEQGSPVDVDSMNPEIRIVKKVEESGNMYAGYVHGNKGSCQDTANCSSDKSSAGPCLHRRYSETEGRVQECPESCYTECPESCCRGDNCASCRARWPQNQGSWPCQCAAPILASWLRPAASHGHTACDCFAVCARAAGMVRCTLFIP